VANALADGEQLLGSQPDRISGAALGAARLWLKSSALGVHGKEGSRSGVVLAFRELGMPFWLAVTLFEQGEWLLSEGRSTEVEPLYREAGEIFERLEARPWLERLDAVQAGVRAEIPA
jgi:hypothetical protein